MNAAYTIRDVRLESDLPRLTELFNGSTQSRTRRSDAAFVRAPGGGFFARRKVADIGGEVAAYCSILHEGWHPPGQFSAYVLVDPRWRGQGIGTALAADIQSFLDGCDVRTLKSEVREDDPAGVALRNATASPSTATCTN